MEQVVYIPSRMMLEITPKNITLVITTIISSIGNFSTMKQMVRLVLLLAIIMAEKINMVHGAWIRSFRTSSYL